MFDKPYRLKGIHSKKARELVAIFDRESKAQFFKAAKDVYAFAPLVGFLYNRRAELDHTKSEETGEELITASWPNRYCRFRRISPSISA